MYKKQDVAVLKILLILISVSVDIVVMPSITVNASNALSVSYNEDEKK
ncbi:MAG: hypothetical protein QXI71_06685 [Candidatus Bathyarchaeia archaeon]